MTGVMAGDVLVEGGDGVDAISGGGSQKANVRAVIKGVGFVVWKVVGGVIVVGIEGLAADKLAPVPEGAVVGGYEFADAMAGEEGSGEDGKEKKIVVVACAECEGLEG